MKAYKFHVTGVVQGVSFRSETVRLAKNLGIYGWVQNERDGSVSGLIQGNDYAIEKMLEFLKKGPQFAKVKTFEKEETEFNRDLNSFERKN